MIKSISLRNYLLTLMLILPLSMSAFLSFQSARSLLEGFRFSHNKLMEEIAIEHDVSKGNPYEAYGYHIAAHWDDVPKEITARFTEPTKANDFEEKFEKWHYFSPPEEVYAVGMILNDEGLPRFVSTIKIKSENKRLNRELHKELWGIDPMIQILLLGILVAVIFYLIVIAIMRHVAKPIESLYLWAQSLKMESLDTESPNFRYRELNSLANIILTSMNAASDTLKREQEFLQYASHELRTPIAVLRTNSALLNKANPNPDERERDIRDRINRASLTMKDMTETLLWLSRESTDDIPYDEISLDDIVRQTAQDLTYLLQGKDITLSFELQKHSLELPIQAARILLTNLVRNAFQHSTSGTINIIQQDNQVNIINSLEGYASDSNNHQDMGFGLGLKLCQKLAVRFNWELKTEQTKQEHIVSITFTA